MKLKQGDTLRIEPLRILEEGKTSDAYCSLRLVEYTTLLPGFYVRNLRNQSKRLGVSEDSLVITAINRGLEAAIIAHSGKALGLPQSEWNLYHCGESNHPASP